jgi:outer membrane lipoprotein-sorting protein
MLKLALCLLVALNGANADPLDDILTKLDRAAAGFRSMTADLTQTAHTGAIDENQISVGKIRIKRDHPGDTRMLVDFSQPDVKSVQLEGTLLDIYLPKLNTVQEYSLGKNSSLIERFLLLGFGTSRNELAAANDITYEGPDVVNSHAAAKLLLLPKDKEVSSRIQKIELWLATDTGYPLQHKIFQAGGDYQLFVFTNLKMNPTLADSAVKLKLPKNVKKETPGR